MDNLIKIFLNQHLKINMYLQKRYEITKCSFHYDIEQLQPMQVPLKSFELNEVE